MIYEIDRKIDLEALTQERADDDAQELEDSEQYDPEGIPQELNFA